MSKFFEGAMMLTVIIVVAAPAAYTYIALT